jgi:hypothetical protein
MQDPAKLREYAEECRRLAKTLKPDHKEALQKIAEAWDQCAREAEERMKGSQPDPQRQ